MKTIDSLLIDEFKKNFNNVKIKKLQESGASAKKIIMYDYLSLQNPTILDKNANFLDIAISSSYKEASKKENLYSKFMTPEKQILFDIYSSYLKNFKLDNPTKWKKSEMKQFYIYDELVSELSKKRKKLLPPIDNIPSAINEVTKSYQNQKTADSMRKGVSNFRSKIDPINYGTIALDSIREIIKESKNIEKYAQINSNDFEISSISDISKNILKNLNSNIDSWKDELYINGTMQIANLVKDIEGKDFLTSTELKKIDEVRKKSNELEEILLFRDDDRGINLSVFTDQVNIISKEHSFFVENKNNFERYLNNRKEESRKFINGDFQLRDIPSLIKSANIDNNILQNRYIQNKLKQNINTKYFVDKKTPTNNREATLVNLLDELYVNTDKKRLPENDLLFQEGKALIYLFQQYKFQKEEFKIEETLVNLKQTIAYNDSEDISVEDFNLINTGTKELGAITISESKDLWVAEKRKEAIDYIKFAEKKINSNIENQYEKYITSGAKTIKDIENLKLLSDPIIDQISSLDTKLSNTNKILVANNDSRFNHGLQLSSRIDTINLEYNHFAKNRESYLESINSVVSLSKGIDSLKSSSLFKSYNSKINDAKTCMYNFETFFNSIPNEKNKYLKNYFLSKKDQFDSFVKKSKQGISAAQKKIERDIEVTKNSIPKNKTWYNSGRHKKRTDKYNLLKSFSGELNEFYKKI